MPSICCVKVWPLGEPACNLKSESSGSDADSNFHQLMLLRANNDHRILEVMNQKHNIIQHVLKDTVLHMNLSMSMCQAQCYDGH